MVQYLIESICSTVSSLLVTYTFQMISVQASTSISLSFYYM